MLKLAAGFVTTMILVACAGDEAPLTGQMFGEVCTNVSDTSTECTSGVCSDAFEQLGIVCSVKCTIGGDASECPAGADTTKKCNMRGYCRP